MDAPPQAFHRLNEVDTPPEDATSTSAPSDFTLKVRNSAQETVTLDVHSELTIAELKRMYAAKAKVDPAKVKLIFLGSLLKDHKTLFDYGMYRSTSNLPSRSKRRLRRASSGLAPGFLSTGACPATRARRAPRDRDGGRQQRASISVSDIRVAAGTPSVWKEAASWSCGGGRSEMQRCGGGHARRNPAAYLWALLLVREYPTRLQNGHSAGAHAASVHFVLLREHVREWSDYLIIRMIH